MRRKGAKDLINKICITQGDVTEEQEQALENMMKELPYLENVCLRHIANGCDYKKVGQILDIPVAYVKYQERKGIRHLRAPKRYYSILLGEKAYAEKLENHKGEHLIKASHLTTKTVNTLERNGFVYWEELKEYIANVPERFAYIAGLGKYGMSEVLYYFYHGGY